MPTELTAERFRIYPPLARALAVKNLQLIGKLPLPFASQLLRELIHYDWKFPMERREIESNFVFLASSPAREFDSLMKLFRAIQLPADLAGADWVSDPIAFSEKLTAHLWATHQIDGFRAAAVVYMDRRTAAFPPESPPVARLTVVAIGEGIAAYSAPLFRKLRPHGEHFANVDPREGLELLLSVAGERAKARPEPFAHWYIDGGHPVPAPARVTSLSYGGLATARALLQRELKSSFEKRVGSELMRSQLAQKKPEDLGLSVKGEDAVLSRFAMSTLTEGSGTQIYSTTFVQWAAREALRRAQPLTMLVRFRPRQRERPMQELLLETERTPDLDPMGSLVDADMGAYYCWLNAQRLPGAAQSGFLAWFEGHKQAVIIGPKVKPGAASDAAVGLRELVSRLI